MQGWPHIQEHRVTASDHSGRICASARNCAGRAWTTKHRCSVQNSCRVCAGPHTCGAHMCGIRSERRTSSCMKYAECVQNTPTLSLRIIKTVSSRSLSTTTESTAEELKKQKSRREHWVSDEHDDGRMHARVACNPAENCLLPLTTCP